MRLTPAANSRRSFSENVAPRLQRGIFALALIGFLFCAFGVPSARAEYVVLKSGQRLVVTGYQLVGDTYKLTLNGGSAELPASEVIAIEPEEVFRSQPKPAFPDIPYGNFVAAAAK